MKRVCKLCQEEFILEPKKPGYSTICILCTEYDVELVMAEQSSGDDGAVESITNNPVSISYINRTIDWKNVKEE